MARNGSGTYSKINTFVAGNSITASGHNANWDDIVTEMTNSVAADGQTTMTGPLKAASGTVSLPGLSFGSDTDCGWYRIGANNLGLALNGAKVLDVATTGLTITGTVNTTGAVKQAGFALLPIGAIFPFAGSAAPSGYLLCDGSSLVRASYPDLFTAIGTTYGAADGTHFTLPDLTGRTVAGKEAAATRLTAAVSGVDGGTLGAVGGSQSHTLTLAQTPTGITSTGSIALNQSNLLKSDASTTNFAAQAGATNITVFATGTVQSLVSPTGSGTYTSNNTGGTAHNNTQPTIVLNYIIFAGV